MEIAVPKDPNGLQKTTLPLSPTQIEGQRLVWNNYFDLKIRYFEIEFNNTIEEELHQGDYYREVIYMPNSVVTFIMSPPESQTDSDKIKVGLKIHLDYLNIDVNAGDFVLIGPGSNPSHRELSNAQIIAENIQTDEDKKKIWINADSAFIR